MLNRFNGNVEPFAKNSTSTNRTVFGGTLQSDNIDDNLNTDYQLGWEIVGVNDNPTKQDFNALGYTHGNLISYLYQQGIPIWNASQKYYVGGRCIGSNGELYKSLYGIEDLPNMGNDPVSPNSTMWKQDKDYQEKDTISDLRLMVLTPEKIFVTGYHTANDGAFGSHFYKLVTDTGQVDNGGTIIRTVNGVYELQYDGAVNVKWFGGNLQDAVNSCIEKQLVEIDSKTYVFTSQVVIPSTCGGLVGSGMTKTILLYDYDQPFANPSWGTTSNDVAHSFIVSSDNKDIVIKDLTLGYSGNTFYNATNSYWGAISGLLLVGCANSLVERVEAYGFNAAGIYLKTEFSTDASGNNGSTVTNCYLHSNRVAGCLYGNQNKFKFDKNSMEYNGHVADGGTGYGVSSLDGWRGSDIKVTNNTTFKNYRKGIDFHDGENITVTNNICNSDRIYGIYYNNRNSDCSALNISNNIVIRDKDFFIDGVDDDGTLYNYFYGISVFAIHDLDNSGVNMTPQVTIHDNILKGIETNTLSAFSHYGIYYRDNTGSTSSVSILNNDINGGDVEYPIFVTTEQGIPAETRENILYIDIAHNKINVQNMLYGVFVTPYEDAATLDSNSGTVNISSNMINFNNVTSSILYVSRGFSSVDIIKNDLIGNTISANKFKIYLYPNAKGTHTVKNNHINIATDNGIAPIFYGSSIISDIRDNYQNGTGIINANRRNNNLGTNTEFQHYEYIGTIVTPKPLLKIGKDLTLSKYKVEWSAYRNNTGPELEFVGGEISFIAGWDANEAKVASPIAVISFHEVYTGAASGLTLTFDINPIVDSLYAFELRAANSHACGIYLTVKETSVYSVTDRTESPMV